MSKNTPDQDLVLELSEKILDMFNDTLLKVSDPQPKYIDIFYSSLVIALYKLSKPAKIDVERVLADIRYAWGNYDKNGPALN